MTIELSTPSVPMDTPSPAESSSDSTSSSDPTSSSAASASAEASSADTVSPEHELIDRAMRGDESALEQILVRYYEKLSNYIRQQLPSGLTGRVGPEDILQHTYLKAFRAVGTFEPRGGYSFFSWLKRIADNERIDQLRKANRELSAAPRSDRDSYVDIVGQLAGDDPTATVLARRRELIGVLHVTLAGMKPQYRQVIELYHLEGKSLEEVAEQLQMSAGQVRGLLHRARASLKDAINRLSRFL